MIRASGIDASRCAENIDHWAAHVGLDIPDAFLAESDRCWYRCDEKFDQSLARLIREKKLVRANYTNHGETAVEGWREARGRCTAQIVLHAGRKVEIDFDLWNPWDLVGLIGHGWEVVTNKLGKRKTDPFKVAEMLRKRGINA